MTELNYDSPEKYYESLIALGQIKNDPKQRAVLKKLNKIHENIKKYSPDNNFLKTIFNYNKPNGIYMYGSVGNGKSLMLKAFYQSAVTDKKTYIHFHDFLLELNYRLKKYNKTKIKDPLKKVAKDILKQSWLYCLDECVLNDIADAMLFARVVEHLIDNGAVIVCTSNFAPDKLKPKGSDSSILKPYIQKFFNRTTPHDINSNLDYRAEKSLGKFPYFLHPLNKENKNKILKFIQDLSNGNKMKEKTILIRGHKLYLYRTAPNICYNTYEHLIIPPYGVEDFNYIAQNYNNVIITEMKKIPDEDTTMAKRFILLVDALYEKRARLIISCEVPPQQLYTGKKVEFEFKRTLSRLKEMQSQNYN